MSERKTIDGTTETPPHGSDAMRQRHIRAGEQPCDLCRKAGAVYMREVRGKNPDLLRRDRERRDARDRAMRRLADRWPRMFERLLAEELQNAPP